MEIINKQLGSHVHEKVSSLHPWIPGVRDRLVELFNIFPGAAMHVQYCLSTNARNSLPFDLNSQIHLNSLHDLLRLLVVPPMLANGKPSKKAMKKVTVMVFLKDDGVQLASGNDKVCIYCKFPKCNDHRC